MDLNTDDVNRGKNTPTKKDRQGNEIEFLSEKRMSLSLDFFSGSFNVREHNGSSIMDWKTIMKLNRILTSGS